MACTFTPCPQQRLDKMTQLEEQFALFKEKYPDATLEPQGNGTAVIVVPSFSLPEGWSKRETRIAFVVPAGFPYARPDCFWADGDLRLPNGNAPANTGNTVQPGVPPGMLWFSYHASTWSPNADSLLTYINVIRGRLVDRR